MKLLKEKLPELFQSCFLPPTIEYLEMEKEASEDRKKNI